MGTIATILSLNVTSVSRHKWSSVSQSLRWINLSFFSILLSSSWHSVTPLGSYYMYCFMARPQHYNKVNLWFFGDCHLEALLWRQPMRCILLSKEITTRQSHIVILMVTGIGKLCCKVTKSSDVTRWIYFAVTCDLVKNYPDDFTLMVHKWRLHLNPKNTSL